MSIFVNPNETQNVTLELEKDEQEPNRSVFTLGLWNTRESTALANMRSEDTMKVGSYIVDSVRFGLKRIARPGHPTVTVGPEGMTDDQLATLSWSAKLELHTLIRKFNLPEEEDSGKSSQPSQPPSDGSPSSAEPPAG